MSDNQDSDDGFAGDSSAGPASPTDESANDNEQTLADADPSRNFASSGEALNIFNDFVPLLGTSPDQIDSTYRELRWWGVGTGSSKVAASTKFTLIDRGLVEIANAGPFDTTLSVESSDIEAADFLLVDTISRDELESQMKKALTAGISADAEQVAALIEDEDRVRALSAADGCGRDNTNFHAGIARNPGDMSSLLNLLTPEHGIDSTGFVMLGGGSSDGAVEPLDMLFRDGPLQKSHYTGHWHELIVQTESRVSNATLRTIGGKQTSTNDQQFRSLQTIEELLGDGYLGAVILTNKPYLALSHAVRTTRMGKGDIEDEVGKLDESADWSAVTDAATGTREVASNRANFVYNDELRRVAAWEHFLRAQPSDYEFLTPEGDHDRSDQIEQELTGKTLVPAVFSIAKPDDIQGRHPEESRPQSLEACIRAGVRFLPHVRHGPFSADQVSSATVAVGVADNNRVSGGDLTSHVETPIADELGLEMSDISGIGVNDLSKWTLPGGASWLDFFGLFAVENHLDTFSQL